MYIIIICVGIAVIILIWHFNKRFLKDSKEKHPLNALYPSYISYPLATNQEQIYTMLHIAQPIFNQENIDTWIICGTLLGAIRHGGVIAWDTDGDIGYDKNSFQNIQNTKDMFSTYHIDLVPVYFGFRLYMKNNVHIDLFQMKEKNNRIVYSSKKARSKYPNEWFFKDEIFPFHNYKFGGLILKGPLQPDNYLSRAYRNDWNMVGRVGKNKHSFYLAEHQKVCLPDPNISRFNTGPIDIVIPWVTDNDNLWRKERTQNGGKPILARYGDHQELRYALRGIELYLPWIRNIILLVHAYSNGRPQIPDWLVLNHPRLRIVTHPEFFGKAKGDLPTFNSTSIECHVHKIPELSDFFLYSNDDFIPLNSMSIDDFMERDGRIKVCLNDEAVPKDNKFSHIHWQALTRIDAMFDSIFGKRTRRFPSHVINLRNRDLEFAKRNFLPQEWVRTSKIKFRSNTDFADNGFVHQHWSLEKGYATERSIDHSYISMKSDKNIYSQIEYIKPSTKIICFNDCHEENNDIMRNNINLMHNFLNKHFPLPSSFERD